MALSGPEAKEISNQPVEIPIEAGHGTFASTENGENEDHVASTASLTPLERKARLKIDIRLCSIAGVLCCLNLLDSGILSSASVTTMQQDLNLQGSHYSVSIFIFTIANVVFNLPCTVCVRLVGPRLWFAASTFCFGIITLSTAFIHTWGQMIALRVLLGISMGGIYPGVTYMISVWYTRREQQVRFALMQSGEVVGLATGNIVNYALNHLDGRAGLAGWRWMFLVQGLIACVVGILTYWWMVDFPEFAHRSFWFLSEKETQAVTRRIQLDRGDVVAEQFSWRKVLRCFKDLKVYGFACMFFLLNIVSTSLNYFLPIILQSGMGFSSNAAIILSTPPYYWAVIPVLLTSFIGDFYRIRGPLIVFNALCLVAGFLMLGLPSQVATRYVGTFLATGAYVSNWAALNTFMANNVVGQWKRATTAATVTAFNGLGSVAGSYIVRQQEAPRYPTAVWVSVGLVFILWSKDMQDKFANGLPRSHILMIGIVGVFSLYFFLCNRGVLQGDNKIKYTY